ncbi:polygalacturonate 4-alpha-galacturonosyltransferase-like isoform X2 [Benincasa hispida]|uniref:polygalacturonate 4-alpha-galacturonosyltransferase-like isoform X2 n=1 Tax=Benincasa hispida TaxID=102211 RepID=UPI0019009031|nr:polygalacturonate 4-alpha-galacturonosyltransferase-like isoform X2 [Benincasa hispida]
MALKNRLVSGSAKNEDEEGSGGVGGYRFILAGLVLLCVFALLSFVVLSDLHTAGEGVISSSPSKEVIDDIAASTNNTTVNISSSGNSNLALSLSLAGVEASVDAISMPSQTTVVPRSGTFPVEEDNSLGAARRIAREERQENQLLEMELDLQGEDTAVKLENTNMQASDLVDSSILGKYSTWKKENDNKNQDSIIRLMRDQIIMARIYLSISKKKKKLDLIEELQICLKRSRRVLGEANIDAELHYSAPQKIKAMAGVLSKARDQLFDCKLVIRKLRAMLLTEEEKIRRLKRQNTFLTQLGVKGIPGGIRCLSLRLTIDYYLLPPEKRNFPRSVNLQNPKFHHYALFTDNVMAAAVVVNSTIMNAKDSSKHVFHLVTDNLNIGALKMWFLLNPPEEATIHVENLDELKWLNSSYCPVLRQLNSAAMREYYFKTGHSTTPSSSASSLKYRNPKYLSMLNHLRFYIPQIYPKLDKILFLDDDVVVQKDLTGLWLVDLEGKVNGAVETCVENFHRFDKYLNFSNPYIAREFDPNACGWAYGMNIFDLKEWKKRNLTGVYHTWQNLNEDRLLWKLGTLPPGLMTFYGLTYSLNKSWHVLGLGYNPSINPSEIENAAVIHYNGNMKPWLEMAMTKYRPYWTKYIDYDHPYLRQCNFLK